MGEYLPYAVPRATSSGTRISAEVERAVPGDQVERPGVVGIDVGHGLPGHEGDVAQTSAGLGGDRRTEPVLVDRLLLAHDPSGVAVTLLAASSNTRAWPGRACSQRNRPSPDWYDTCAATSACNATMLSPTSTWP